MTFPERNSCQTIGFLLVENFALMSYASAIEPLRAANLMAATDLFNTVPLTMEGGTVQSSSGAIFRCEDLANAGLRCHTVFVCAGGSRSDWNTALDALPILRRLSRSGVRMGGISSGSFMLAAAGLLENRDFTIHWEHVALLKEMFPHLAPRQARYVIDGDRLTCAGGIAPLDMMHALISERMGSEFARRVGDWYLHTSIAEPSAPQRSSASERFGTHHQALLGILEKMEATIERPLSRQQMATLVGLSERHLDRLFSEKLGATFLGQYRQIRLQHARRLIEQSPLTLEEISYATGFSSPSHFSSAYKKQYGLPPGVARGQKRVTAAAKT